MDIELEEFYTFPTRVKIASILRKAIFSGDIKAGEELSLTDISNKLNVSRTPVREAFQILENENLLELRMNKGAIVKCIDDNFFKDYYEVKILFYRSGHGDYCHCNNNGNCPCLKNKTYERRGSYCKSEAAWYG